MRRVVSRMVAGQQRQHDQARHGRQQQALAADDETADPPIMEGTFGHALSLAPTVPSRRVSAIRVILAAMLFEAMDLGATFVFAISGATQGVQRRLDLFGVAGGRLGSGVAGGLARDLLIGAVPPAAIADWRYLATAVAAGLVGFFASDVIARLQHAGAAVRRRGPLPVRRHRHPEGPGLWGSSPVMAAVLGMITCIGGGVARDLLTLQVPTVLARRTLCRGRPGRRRLDFAGLRGWACRPCPLPCAGAGLCLFLRLMSIYRGWRLPIASLGNKSSKETD